MHVILGVLRFASIVQKRGEEGSLGDELELGVYTARRDVGRGSSLRLNIEAPQLLKQERFVIFVLVIGRLGPLSRANIALRRY